MSSPASPSARPSSNTGYVKPAVAASFGTWTSVSAVPPAGDRGDDAGLLLVVGREQVRERFGVGADARLVQAQQARPVVFGARR